MRAKAYRELLEVMKSRGGPYSGADIPEFYALVEEFFAPDEAEVNNALSRKPMKSEEIAGKMSRNPAEVGMILEKMADKGLCGVHTESGVRLWHGLGFMPGIFEFHFFSGGETERDKKIAKLIHAYKKAYDSAKGIAPITYPVTRVIPVAQKIRAGNTIHTYDQVMTYIEKNDNIGVGTCYCRHAAKLRGEDIHDMPLEVCMWFGTVVEQMTERLGGRRVSKREAKEILDRCEEIGLIHMSRNTTDEIDFLCNCDRWHCAVVAKVMEQPKPGLVFNSGFEPVFDAESCIACGTCVERCPPAALTLTEDVPEMNPDLCFGCGVCATGCRQEAITMDAKPGFPIPPKDAKELVAALKTRKM